MSVIYTDPRFVGKDLRGCGYEKYIRDVYCTCGKKIGTQTKYVGYDKFYFDDKEKSEYNFCPYCGIIIKY